MRRPLTTVVLVLVCVTAAAAMVPAQSKTATTFYLEYRKAFEAAKTIDEVLPFLAKGRREQVEKTPAAERAQMFGMMKMLGVVTNLKIVKETKTAAGFDLEATATDADGKPSTGIIHIVREGTELKVDKESWTTKS